jgi:hypothetical protein
MMERSVDYKRMVLGLPRSAGDYASVAFTARLAALLGLDLVGLFVEDEDLAHIAALPCVRELRSPDEGWQAIDAGQLARWTEQAAAEARRRFEDAARSLRLATQISFAKGSIAEIVGSYSSVDDIFAVIEPRNPAERVTHQYRQLVERAFSAPAATLLVPSRVGRSTGPVVAVAASGQDPSIPAALRIAASSKEQLIVLAPPGIDRAAMARLAELSRVSVDWRPLPGKPAGMAELAFPLSRIKERILVLSRAPADGRLSSQLASGRGVPVLLTEPAETEKT